MANTSRTQTTPLNALNLQTEDYTVGSPETWNAYKHGATFTPQALTHTATDSHFPREYLSCDLCTCMPILPYCSLLCHSDIHVRMAVNPLTTEGIYICIWLNPEFESSIFDDV